MTRPAAILPASLAPRGLSRGQSAAWAGIGTTKFDEMVADGRMPPPKEIDGRKIWDRYELEEAFSALPGGAANGTDGDVGDPLMEALDDSKA